MNLSRMCGFLFYDTIALHIAVVFTQYMALYLENQEFTDIYSSNVLFLYFSDRMVNII